MTLIANKIKRTINLHSFFRKFNPEILVKQTDKFTDGYNKIGYLVKKDFEKINFFAYNEISICMFSKDQEKPGKHRSQLCMKESVIKFVASPVQMILLFYIGIKTCRHNKE